MPCRDNSNSIFNVGFRCTLLYNDCIPDRLYGRQTQPDAQPFLLI